MDLSDKLFATLRDLRRQRKEEWLADGRKERDFGKTFVFRNRGGNPVNILNISRRHFHPCLEKAELRRIRFHDLRHTYASLLIQKGYPMKYIQRQLGHSSIKLTVDTYGHLVPGADREVLNSCRRKTQRHRIKKLK